MMFPTHRESGISHLPRWVRGMWCPYLAPLDWRGLEAAYEWVEGEDVVRVCARCRNDFEFHMASRLKVQMVLGRAA